MSRAIDADAFGANAVGRHVGLCVIAFVRVRKQYGR